MQSHFTLSQARHIIRITIFAMAFMTACTSAPEFNNQDHGNNTKAVNIESVPPQSQQNESHLLVQMGDKLKALGDYARAQSQYERALGIDNNCINAKLALADLYLKTDLTKQATGLYQGLLRNNPPDSLVQKIGHFLGQPYEIIQITHGSAQHAFPDIAPDNKRLACQSDENDNWDIYVLNVDGSNRTRITTDPARDEAPNWSPDGKEILFTSTRDDSIHIHTELMRREIYLYNFSDQSQLRLTNSSADDWAPVFSPKGNAILFESNRNVSPADSNGSDLFLLDRVKEKLSRITFENGVDGTASFINKNKILFASNRSGKFDIYTMKADGNNPVRLFEFSGQNAGPTMHRKGHLVAFYAKIDDNFDLFLYHIKTGKVERLTFNRDIDAHPKFSPDGKRIYFHSRQSGRYQIYAILLEKPVRAESLIAQLDKLNDVRRTL